MKQLALLLAALFACGGTQPAHAAPLDAPCLQSSQTASECDVINSSNPIPTNSTSDYPVGATPITGNATGSTGAVVGTLAATSGKTTYICGFSVSAIGGTAAVGPITIAGTTGSSLVYQLASSTAGSQLTQTFRPCIPASAVNTSITTTTTADGTASGVDVNSWGYQK